MIRFSPSTKCFYPDDIDYHTEPGDLIDVNHSDYNMVMSRPNDHGFSFTKGVFKITPPNIDSASLARHKRDVLLQNCDYMAMPDYPLPVDDVAELREYRRRLRDITEQPKFPAEIIWPAKPEFVK